MSAGARVFVRLYDGATHREGDGELLMLPPPPLTWKGVLSMMIQAVSKDDVEPDDAAIARARLFLLPTDTQGIVAELNARSLRFGVRDNDQFAVCLYGEEYRRPSESAADTTLPVAATDAAATLTTMAALPALNVTTTRLNDSYQSHQQPQDPQNHGPPRGSLFGNSGSAAPPGGSILGSSDASGGGRKTSKRYRSISGKMAAIKSLGDKGIISAEDRGHLKDLLLNNDSPALQEALDNYQNTGDFQAVKDLLMKELRTPSAKRATSDWLPEGLINEISENFQTHDNDDQSGAYSRYQNHTPTNPFMYGSSTASTTTGHASPSQASDYTTTTDHHDQAVHPLTNASGYEEQQQESWSSESTGGGIYAQQQATTYGTTSTPQINLPLRNRNSVNLMLKHRGVDGSSPVAQQLPSQSMLHGNPVEIGYAQQHPGAMPGYAMAPAAGYPAMGYATPATGDYSQMGMTAAYGVPMHASPVHAQMGYSPYYRQQQPMMYGVSPYGQQYAMSGYDYYAQQGYGYMRAGQLGGRMGMGGKWTTAPPMPAYPPPCSKEEKKEKIAKWLKKRENRNWSNKPSYPVRHNIAKNRKRGEDGRFITKKRLAEMEKEEAARIAAGLPPTIRDDDNELDNDQYQDDEDGSGSDQDGSTMPLGMLDGNEFTGLPTPVHT